MKKKIAIALGATLLLVFSVKYFYQDSEEEYGFDASYEADEFKNWFLIRLFTPATTTGVHEEIRERRISLLGELSKWLPHEAGEDTDEIAELRKQLRENDQAWDEVEYFVETRARASYYSRVTAPREEEPTIPGNDFAVRPFFIYAGTNARALRWVSDPQLKIQVRLDGPNGETRLLRSKSSDTYHEVIISGLSQGEWRWSGFIDNGNAAAISGKFHVRVPRSMIFYADSQDSHDLHARAIEFIGRLNEEEPIDLLVHGGDLTSWGSNEADLQRCASIVARSSIAFVSARGNHEFTEDYGYTSDSPYFDRLFALPEQVHSPYFGAFDFGQEGRIRVVVWDTNFVRLPTDLFIAQDRFLRNELNDDGTRTILVGHHSALTKGWHGSFMGSHSEVWIRELYAPWFQNSNLVLSLAGHDHVYQRIIDNESERKTTHVVAGPTSAQILYPYFKTNGDVQRIERRRTVTRIDVRPPNDGAEQLSVRTYDIETGELFDEFEIEL